MMKVKEAIEYKPQVLLQRGDTVIIVMLRYGHIQTERWVMDCPTMIGTAKMEVQNAEG